MGANLAAIAARNQRPPIMKHILALTLLALAAALPVAAQNTVITGTTTNAPQNIPSFFNEAANWVISIDPTKTWTNATFQAEDGINQTTGVNLADYLRVQYNWDRFNVSAEGDFLGVGAAFSAAQAGVGYALIQKGDLEIEANILIGGTKINESGVASQTMRFKAEPEIKLTKLMTANTYSTISMGLPWVQGQTFDGTPSFRAGMGFTF